MTINPKQKSKEAMLELYEVALFVFKDTATLLLFLLGNAVGEIVMRYLFSETHPFVQLLRQLPSIIFACAYPGLILFDIYAFLTRRKRRLNHEVWE